MKKNYFSCNKLKAALSGAALFAMTWGLNAQVFQTQTFNFSNGMATFTVPNCVANVTIICYGAEGVGADGFSPGTGGAAKGVLAVTPGQVLNLFVGGSNGFNGGGLGKGITNGGGATDVRVGGTGLANRIIVAGGGGGAGGDSWQCNSGSGDGGGGTAVGTNFKGGAGGAGYTFGSGCGTDGGNSGGSGGTGYHGGGGGGGGFTTGGQGACANQGCAQNGSLGQGGNAHMVSYCGNTGGGGGGYYGGGGAAGENCGAGRGGGGSSWTGTLASPSFTAGGQTGDGKIILLYDFNFNGVVANATPNGTICPGTNVTINASNVLTYTWTGVSGSGMSVNVAPNVTTSYTVQGTNNVGCVSTAIITVPVFVGPPLAAAPTNTFLCAGQSATLVASGTSNYTWTAGGGPSISNSATLVVTPASTTNYILSASGASGCIYTVSALATVNNLSLTVSPNATVCVGKQASLAASGAVTYNWSNPNWSNGIPFANVNFVPTVASVYTVTGIDVNNCTLTNTVNIGLYPVASVTATSNKQNVCVGEPVNLTGSGASTYTWNVNSLTGANVTVTMTANLPVTYSVTGTDANGCNAKAHVTVQGYFCTGINEVNAADALLSVYPNPNAGTFSIKSDVALDLTIVNALGQTVKTVSIPESSKKVTIDGLSSGFYFITGVSNGQKFTKKVIVEN
jgi:hypothetical protein